MTTRIKAFEVYPGSPDLFLEAGEMIALAEWVPSLSKFYVLIVPQDPPA